jgi:hypothetical protein
MRIRYTPCFRFIWMVLGLCALSISLLAQDKPEMRLNPEAPRGHFVTLPARLRNDMLAASTARLQTWNGSFNFSGRTVAYNMVGAAPSANTTVTIPVYIIPVKIVVIQRSTKFTFDPTQVLPNGNTVVQNTVASPIFDATTTYTLGGVNVGTTQYLDAFQRANFWGTVKNNPNSHLLLGGPTVLPVQTLSPPANYGTAASPFGFNAGIVDINWFDSQLPMLITKLGIAPNALPIFLTYDVYLTQGGGCCIGGYHSSEGLISNPQSYVHATYVDRPGVFAQDVSALSHEIGEWVDDPLTVNYKGNYTPCGALEVGDPLEGTAHFGGYPYVLHGFTYNLQDLVMLPYFGAPPSTSVNGWLSFRGENLGVCSNGS